MMHIKLDDDEGQRDFSKFMEIPSEEQERQCYEAFYDAMSNMALKFRVCPVCAQEKLANEGEQTSLLSEPSIRKILVNSPPIGNRQPNMIILEQYVER